MFIMPFIDFLSLFKNSLCLGFSQFQIFFTPILSVLNQPSPVDSAKCIVFFCIHFFYGKS